MRVTGKSRIKMGAVAAAAACGIALAGWSTAAGAPADTAPENLDAVRALMTSLDLRINGDLPDMRATQLLTYAAYQGQIRQCMAEAGYSYTPPPFVDPYRSWDTPRPPAPHDEFRPTSARHIADHGLYLAEDIAATADDPTSANPGHDNLDAAGQAQYGRQLDVCQPAPDTYQGIGTPALADTMAGQFTALFDAVVATPEIQQLAARYPACMAGKGYRARVTQDLIAGLRPQFNALLDRSDNRLKISTTSATFTHAAAAERRAAEADAACRTDVHHLALTRIAPKLRQFETDHQTDLARLTTQWEEIRTRANQAAKHINW